MAITLLSVPARTAGSSTGYAADMNALIQKINELATAMAVSPLTIAAAVGAGNPAADMNTVVAKINELIGGTTTTPPPATATKATVPRFGTIDDVNNTVAVSSDYAYTEVVVGLEGGTGQQLASNSIFSAGNVAGRVFAYVVANSAANRLQSDTVYSAPFMAAANNAPTATLALVGGSTIFTAGQSATFNLGGSDPDAGDSLTKLELLDNGTSVGQLTTAGAIQTPALTAGNHTFTCRVTDTHGATGLSAASTLTVNAATRTGTKIFWAAIGNSFDTPGGSDTANPVYIDAAYQQLGSPVNLELHHYGYPGKTLQFIIDTYLATIINEINAAKAASTTYGKCVVTLHEGENGLIEYTAADAYLKTANVCGQLKALAGGGFAVEIILVPIARRVTGVNLPADFNTRRTTLNNSLRSNYATIADAFVEPNNQLSVWGDQYPIGYPNTYCSDGTHPTTEGARIDGAEVAQTMRPFVGVAAISPAYVRNIGYTAPPAGIDPETLPWEYAQMTGAGTSQPADFSNLTQAAADSGNFSTVANGLKKGRSAAGQTFIQDVEFTLGNAALQHVFGMTVNSATSDGNVLFRAYPNNGTIRIWVDGAEVTPAVARTITSNDLFRFRINTDSLQLFHQGTQILSVSRSNTVEYKPAIVFGNLNPGDFFVVRQRGVNLVAYNA